MKSGRLFGCLCAATAAMAGGGANAVIPAQKPLVGQMLPFVRVARPKACNIPQIGFSINFFSGG